MPRLTGSSLSAISCVSSSRCIAVGDYNRPTEAALAGSWDGSTWAQHMNQAESTLTLAERLSGGIWRLQPTAQPSVNKVLFGVSCLTATQCTAAGQTLATVQHQVVQALAEHSS